MNQTRDCKTLGMELARPVGGTAHKDRRLPRCGLRYFTTRIISQHIATDTLHIAIATFATTEEYSISGSLINKDFSSSNSDFNLKGIQ